MPKKITSIVILLTTILLGGCTTSQINHSPPYTLATQPAIAVAPFTNTTETPQADASAATITAGLLRAKGANNLMTYPAAQTTKFSIIPGVTSPLTRQQLLSWANQRGANYLITGNVNEWRYKVGLDGEPVVGVTLELLSVPNGQILWSAVGSKSGGSRTAVSTVAQRLISNMLTSLYIR